ncbi:LiaF-related protein [Nocardioides sp. BP30]|uniref:LiaF domain-containing protein n=1 Tax=Nocardioides sp. BP30 TaxID=3036374 RepID=UPI0024686163|nr:LiaF domain-containing protein [Nocardioides sp. BP30]WGL51652.1 LiaF-related protein [Nocardioides sp. BP30]
MSESGSAAKDTTLHLALLGGLDRRGPWEVRRRTVAISPVGGIDLDLTEATLPEGGATIVKVSFVGGAKLRVPAGVNVVVEGFNVIGRRTRDTGPSMPGAPTVRLLAYGIFGGVRVERAR